MQFSILSFQLYSNAAIYWLITKTSESETIVIDIQDISLEFSSECVYDKLTIYDGKIFILLVKGIDTLASSFRHFAGATTFVAS